MSPRAWHWFLQVLQNSIEPNFYIQLKQIYDTFDEKKQGGILLYRLIVGLQYDYTYENKELYQSSIKSYRLLDTPGEDVPISLACFGAVVEMLEARDVPSHLVKYMLQGHLSTTVDEYKDFVKSLLAQLDSPLYEEWEQKQGGQAVLLGKFASKLRQQYHLMQSKQRWTPASSSSKTTPTGSFFPARASPANNKPRIPPTRSSSSGQHTTPPPNAAELGLVPPREEWQQWFDQQICQRCKGRHPTKYHDDTGIRNRWFRPKEKSGKSRAPRIQASKAQDFKKRIYQAMFDCVEEEDKSLLNECEDWDEFINMANGSETEPSREEATDEPDIEEDDTESQAMALAAMSLSSLLNYRAA